MIGGYLDWEILFPELKTAISVSVTDSIMFPFETRKGAWTIICESERRILCEYVEF